MGTSFLSWIKMISIFATLFAIGIALPQRLGEFREENFGKSCKISNQKDGNCDSINNNAKCNWDGGDCCGSPRYYCKWLVTLFGSEINCESDSSDCGDDCKCLDPKEKS